MSRQIAGFEVCQVADLPFLTGPCAEEMVIAALVPETQEVDTLGETLVGSFTVGGSSPSLPKKQKVRFTPPSGTTSVPVPKQIETIKDFWEAGLVDLGKCEGVRCADTGESLPPEQVMKGRLREIEQIANHSTWRYVDAGSCRGKTVKCRWVDRCIRGTDTVKSRFCCMEFAWDLRGDTFAGTPPLTAVRMVVSRAATGERHCLMVTDITCAFLHSSMEGEPPSTPSCRRGSGPLANAASS